MLNGLILYNTISRGVHVTTLRAMPTNIDYTVNVDIAETVNLRYETSWRFE